MENSNTVCLEKSIYFIDFLSPLPVFFLVYRYMKMNPIFITWIVIRKPIAQTCQYFQIQGLILSFTMRRDAAKCGSSVNVDLTQARCSILWRFDEICVSNQPLYDSGSIAVVN